MAARKINDKQGRREMATALGVLADRITAGAGDVGVTFERQIETDEYTMIRHETIRLTIASKVGRT